MRLSSHEGGGGWPGGLGGAPPGPLGGSLFGNGVYSGNVMQGGSVLQPVGGVLTITGAATVVPDATTGASVLVCDTLILDGAGASLMPSTNSKGLLVFAKTRIQLLNGAKLNIDKLGKAGNFGNLTAVGLLPANLKSKLNTQKLQAYVALGEGAAGGATLVNATRGGNAGAAAATMQTGGGSSGTVYNDSGVNGGKGGKGGPCCGGAGAGAAVGNAAQTLEAAGDYGGPGGMGNGAGAYVDNPIPSGPGDPVGASYGGGAVATGGGGGLLMLFSPIISIASGCVVSADGAAATLGTGTPGSWCPSGAAGGGCVVCVTRSGGYSNAGTVRASGGLNTAGVYTTGGAGGAGSVNLFTAA